MLRQEFDDVFSTGTVQNFSMESNSTGDLRYYRISKIPMHDDHGDVTHVITIGEDVTESREAQERFAQAEKLAAIGQLAAGVLHEINNPQATIAACAESLALALGDARSDGARIPAETGEYLRIVESEVQRSKRIVDRLLEFSRPKPLTPEPVDVNAVVEQTLFLLKHHTRFKRFTVQLELADAPPVTLGNTEQLVQVLMALLINAMDATGEQGTIDVRTRRVAGPPALAVIEVRDHGHGIPRSQLAKIFEPFYTTKAPGRGTGLGLSICYGIIAEHGGRIEAESLDDAGTIFRVQLPAGDVS
jgi:two-component system NtrC family sensor kinase